jgi:hypothetical protein
MMCPCEAFFPAPTAGRCAEAIPRSGNEIAYPSGTMSTGKKRQSRKDTKKEVRDFTITLNTFELFLASELNIRKIHPGKSVVTGTL